MTRLPKKSGLFGVAEQKSDISLACRRYAPIKFNEKFELGDVVFRERRSLILEKTRIARGRNVKRTILIYMVHSDGSIEGSPRNSASTVPIEPRGGGEARTCADWVKGRGAARPMAFERLS